MRLVWVVNLLTSIKFSRLSRKSIYFYAKHELKISNRLTLSFPDVLLNSPNLNQYFSLNKFGRILLFIFISLFSLINSHFLVTICLILYVLCKKKLAVNNWLGLEGLIWNLSLLHCAARYIISQTWRKNSNKYESVKWIGALF